MKQPNIIELLHQILAPIMPMVRLDQQLILLGGLEHAIVNEDETVSLHFSSQRTIDLNKKQVETLTSMLADALKQAQQMQAQQRAAERFLIKPH